MGDQRLRAARTRPPIPQTGEKALGVGVHLYWVAVKELNSSYHDFKSRILSTIYCIHNTTITIPCYLPPMEILVLVTWFNFLSSSLVCGHPPLCFNSFLVFMSRFSSLGWSERKLRRRGAHPFLCLQAHK